MSAKLFIKVNKKRSLAFRNVSEEITMLAKEGQNYIELIFELVKKILKRINFVRDNSIEGGNYTALISKDTFSFLEKSYNSIHDGFKRILIMTELLCLRRADGVDDSRDEGYTFRVRAMTSNIFILSDRIRREINKIIDDITKIKREKFCRDIDYVVYVFKDAETRLSKTTKEIASLFVQD